MNTINIAAADRPRCAVRGLVAPRGMCSAIIVGAEFCGSDKACAHRVAAPQLAQRFDAADMATASAQGFRDGVASLSLTAAGQEPVAWLYEHKLLGTKQAFTTEPPPGLKEKCTPLYTHPSPPEGMAGWRPISEMRAVVAVAVTMLYDTHPEDVLRVFDLCELEKISIITMLLGSQQVEDIYRGAWDQLTAAPGPDDGGSNG